MSGDAIRADQRTRSVYKITYPNGKIYIGMDMTDSINYFGSACSKLISQDFSREQRQSFTVTREIIWDSDTASLMDVRRKEVELIRAHRANDPKVGYNRWPRYELAQPEIGKQLEVIDPHNDA